MAVSTGTNNATYNVSKLQRVKAVEFDLTLDEDRFKDAPQYETDTMGRITRYEDDTTVITYKYEYDNSDIKKAFQVPDMCEINVMAEIKVGDHTIRVYGTDEIDIDKLIELSKTLSLYNETILEYFEKYFDGIIIGDPLKCSNMQYQTNRDRSYESISFGIPHHYHVYTTGGNFGPNVQIHELAHFVMSALYEEDKWDGNKVYELCEKYESWLCGEESATYKRETHNPSEFFADASAVYFLEPDKMKKEAPDLYEFLDGIYGGK